MRGILISQGCLVCKGTQDLNLRRDEKSIEWTGYATTHDEGMLSLSLSTLMAEVICHEYRIFFLSS